METGFIKIHRKILGWEWYSDSKTVHLFIHLLLSANHKEKKWKGITINRGQVVIGREELSKTLMISPQSIRTCLERLKSTSEITIKSTNKFSVVTIVKYDEYQTREEKSTSKSTSKLTNNQPAINQQSTTNKNDKNDKNEKNNILQSVDCEVIDTLPDLLSDKQNHIKIVGLYARATNVNFQNREQQDSFIRRNVKAAKLLIGYDFQRIIDTMKYLIDNADFKWTLETVGKYIDTDLLSIKNNDDEIIDSFFEKYKQ